MKLKIKVHPKSGKQEVVKVCDDYEVWVKSESKNNKANIELIKLLSKYFNTDVKILSGKTSKNKIVGVKK